MRRLSLLLGLAMLASPASAADVRLKAPVLTSVCTSTDCSGFFVGFNIAGQGSNLDIIGSGVSNSVFAGGGKLGLNAGYQFWNGTLFFRGEAVGDWNFNPGGLNTNDGKYFVAALAKMGVGLNNVLGIGLPGQTTTPTPSQGPIPLIAGTTLLSPYVTLGGAMKSGKQGWVTGGGFDFILAKGWNLDLNYMHVNYSNGTTTMVGTTTVGQPPADNIVMVELLRKF